MDDKLNLRDIGYAKRLFECMDFLPEFRKKFNSNIPETLQEYGIPLALRDYSLVDFGDYYVLRYPNLAIELYTPFYKSVNKKIRDRYNQNKYPKNEKMRNWYQKKKDDFIELGIGRRANYCTIAFELTYGCSVGCSFCGFASKKLSAIYEATKENLNLFENLLDIAMDIMGDTVKEGFLYHTTEPLDNPNYELFSDIFFQKTGVIPQMTTAVALRDVQRTKKILRQVNENGNTYHRFSIMSVEDLFRVYKVFLPEELLYTILEPRFDGNLVSSGRQAQKENKYSGTISGTIGFVINMCQKTISLRYLCDADKWNPTGEVNLCTVPFRDEIEFEELILEIIEKKM